MKTILFLLLLAGICLRLTAQKDTTDNYVKKFLSIPAITLTIVPDSTAYTNKNLKKGSPFVLVFFNPDCDHCQKETKELLAYKEALKAIQILMVSSATYSEIKDFYKTFGLSAMPNIKVGHDANHKLAGIYRLTTFPAIFVYDHNGNLAKAFTGNIGVPAILDAVK